jgi:hypothetical protein
MATALQNIERAKGAAQERRAIMAEIRSILKIYKRDLVLESLLDWIKAREASGS